MVKEDHAKADVDLVEPLSSRFANSEKQGQVEEKSSIAVTKKTGNSCWVSVSLTTFSLLISKGLVARRKGGSRGYARYMHRHTLRSKKKRFQKLLQCIYVYFWKNKRK